jgi:hypothetical protein
MRQISKFKILLVNLTLVFCFQTYGQVKISGKVCDNNTGETLRGVNIIEHGTENKIVSETNGTFNLTVSNSESAIEITYLGYKKQEIKIGDKRYFEIKLKEDCFLDFFDYNSICLGLSTGILNSPIGGFVYIKQPIRKIGLIYGEFDYQTDLKNSYKIEAHTGLLHLVAECDYDGDVYLNYRKLVNQDFKFNSYSLIGKLNLSKPRIFQNYSTLYFGYGISTLNTPDITYNDKSGYILGFGTSISKTHININFITTYWTNYWEYFGEIKWEYRNVLISMNYDNIKNHNELNLKLGYIFNY